MTQVLTYAIAGAAFLAILWFIRTQPNWSRGEDGKLFSAPGWWRPLAVGWFVAVAVFVVAASLMHGFKWGMLLAFPILGAAFALGIAVLSAVGRAQDT
jgi:hypothetical protein